MREASERQVTTLAFCLLSAWVFRGERSLDDICSLALDGIREGSSLYPSVREISLFAFAPEEQAALRRALEKAKSASD